MLFQTLIENHRRRYFLSIAFAAFGGLLAFGLIGAVLFAVGIAGIGFLVLTYVPKYRSACESLAFGAFIAALIHVPAEAMTAATIGLSFLFHAAAYGQWSDRLGLSLTIKINDTRDVAGRAVDVWDYLVPAEGHPDDYWSETLIDFSRDPDDEETVYIRFRHLSGLVHEMTITFLERKAGRGCRYYVENDEMDGRGDMEVSLRLEKLDTGGIRILSEIEQKNLPPRIAIARWFDDNFGRDFNGLRSLAKVDQHEKSGWFAARLPNFRFLQQRGSTTT